MRRLLNAALAASLTALPGLLYFLYEANRMGWGGEGLGYTLVFAGGGTLVATLIALVVGALVPVNPDPAHVRRSALLLAAVGLVDVALSLFIVWRTWG